MKGLCDARAWRRRLMGADAGRQPDAFARQTSAFVAGHGLVRVFYAALLFLLLDDLREWPRWLAAGFDETLWPVSWMAWAGVPFVVNTAWTLALLGAGLCLLFPGRRWARVMLFLGLLQFVALTYSGVKIKHHWHGWLWVSLCLAFLPDGDRASLEASRARRQMHLGVVFGAQCALALFYSLSGAFKLGFAGAQALIGDVHGLHPMALAYQLAGYLARHSEAGMLGGWLLEHPLLGFPAYQLAIYLELFSLVAVFRPSVHRVWGLALIAFHVGNELVLGIAFTRQLLLVGLLFVCSPTAPPTFDWRRTACDLPLLGGLARRLGLSPPVR